MMMMMMMMMMMKHPYYVRPAMVHIITNDSKEAI